jgi:hypothetical protein
MIEKPTKDHDAEDCPLIIVPRTYGRPGRSSILIYSINQQIMLKVRPSFRAGLGIFIKNILGTPRLLLTIG